MAFQTIKYCPWTLSAYLLLSSLEALFDTVIFLTSKSLQRFEILNRQK